MYYSKIIKRYMLSARNGHAKARPYNARINAEAPLNPKP